MVSPNAHKFESGFSSEDIFHPIEGLRKLLPGREDLPPAGVIINLQNPEGVRGAIQNGVQNVVGEEMENATGIKATLDALHQSSSPPNRPKSSEAEQQVSTPPSSSVVMTPASPHQQHLSPQNITKGIVTSGAIAGGAYGVFGGVSGYLISGSAVLAAPYFISGAISGGATYALGTVHNALWKKEGKQPPGGVGTFLRGMVAPVTIPVGLIRNLTWNKKAA